ncbi:kinase-like domain-containing protein, partial [Suillus ampliporus]
MAEPATDEDFTSQISGTLDPENYCEAGAFGEVYRRTIQSNKGPMEVAVKVFKIDAGIEKERIKKGIYRELKVWLRLKHTTIVPLLGTANVDSPFPALVSQWMPSGTLYVYLKQPTTISASARVELARGVAKGLKYLHSENVVHGDLHPANVLIDSFGSPRLTDFGLAAVPGDADLQLSTMTASRTLDSRWRAPEVIGIDRDPERPTFKSDIYSFGAFTTQITSGDVPWKDKKHSHQITIELSRKTAPARPDHILDDHWKLIKQCWSWDPVDRPGAAEVI